MSRTSEVPMVSVDVKKTERTNAKRAVTKKINQIAELLGTEGNVENVAREREALTILIQEFQTTHESYLEGQELTEGEKTKEGEYLNEMRTREAVLDDRIGRYCKAEEDRLKAEEGQLERTNQMGREPSPRKTKTIKSCSSQSRKSALQKAKLEAERKELEAKLARIAVEELLIQSDSEESEQDNDPPAGDEEDRTSQWVKEQVRLSHDAASLEVAPQGHGNQWAEQRAQLNPRATPFVVRKEAADNSDSRLAEMFETIHLPKVEIIPFAGDPLKYWPFIKSFDNNVGRMKHIDDNGKLTRLLSCCKERALTVIAGCAAKPMGGYARARQLLEERFGNRYVISTSWLNKICNGPRYQVESLQDHADELRSFKETMEAMECLPEVNQIAMGQIADRLPRFLRQRWTSRATTLLDQNGQVQLEDLVSFIERAAREQDHPVFGGKRMTQTETSNRENKILKRAAKQDEGHRGRSFAANVEQKHDKKTKICAVCGEGSCTTLFKCKKFIKDMKAEERLHVAMKHRLCFNCLIPGHSAKDCRSESTCPCPKKHTKFLHAEPAEAECHLTSSHKTTNRVALPIVPVLVRKERGRSVVTHALLDSGSTGTFCSATLARRLGSVGKDVSLNLTTLKGKDSVPATIHEFVISDLEGGNATRLCKVYVTGEDLPISSEPITTLDIEKWDHLRDIPFPPSSGKVELLIGQDRAELLVPMEIRTDRKEREGAPIAARTRFGWTLNGPVRTGSELTGLHASVGFIATADLERQMKQFWDVEGIGLRKDDKGLSGEDRQALGVMSSTCRRVDGHYEVAIPMRAGANLPDNRTHAVKRLEGLRRRLLRDSDLRKLYTEQMEDLITKGYAEEACGQPEVGQVWYIPHHPVFNPKKSKPRIVFDCAAQFRDTSINQQALQGPDLNNRLVGVLLRFRQEQVALSADIEAMFHQVRVPECQRDLLRFLWYKDGDLSKEPLAYRMTVHLFGGTWSPSVCSFALRQTGKDYGKLYDVRATEALQRDFYVDDFLKTVPSIEEGRSMVRELSGLVKQGGFRLCKWISNKTEVIQDIPDLERAAGVRELSGQALPVEQALGVKWDIQTDELVFLIQDLARPVTRRGMLSIVSSLYDPYGLVSSFTVRGRILVQEAVRRGCTWDEPLPEDLRSKWLDWMSELQQLQKFHIPRCVRPPGFQIQQAQLHHFADASTAAYGAVSYLHLSNECGESHTTLLYARARVSPIKSMSIPRLELAAAAMAVQQDEMLRAELELPVEESRFYTDSTIVLAYINNPGRRFHTFVANRLAIIWDGSSPDQWQHVPSQLNPADDVSRGLPAQDLLDSQRWLQGPRLPLKVSEPEQEYDLEEDPEVKALNTKVGREERNRILEAVEHISSWDKARAAIAICRRLVNKKRGPCSAEELREGELTIIRALQEEAFGQEIEILKQIKQNGELDRVQSKQRNRALGRASSIYRLDPFLDAAGMLRVGGRIKRSSMRTDVNQPIILPRKHHVTQLIVQHCHQGCRHQGRGRTAQEIQTRGYWITGLRSAVAKELRSCVTCHRHFREPEGQKMADLPEERVEASPPFSFCGADLFGPFLIKEGRRQLKRYGVLFTCLASRSIHIEVANQLTTDSFINALRRLIALRGHVSLIRSDQGTNFVGASKELAKEAKLEVNKVREFLAKQGCEFRFNPPSASHMGGVWERQIRSVRRVLTVLLKEFGEQLSDEALRTVMAEAVAIVNGRPLSVSNMEDPDQLEPLTPNHLLTQKDKTILPPPGEFVREDVYLSKYWRRVQYVVDQFWRRWRSEYLLSLQERQRWTKERENLMIGDIVLVKDDHAPRNQWVMARVVKANPDEDGLVRRVTLRLGTRNLDATGKPKGKFATLERPIHKLVLLLRAQ